MARLVQARIRCQGEASDQRAKQVPQCVPLPCCHFARPACRCLQVAAEPPLPPRQAADRKGRAEVDSRVLSLQLFGDVGGCNFCCPALARALLCSRFEPLCRARLLVRQEAASLSGGGATPGVEHLEISPPSAPPIAHRNGAPRSISHHFCRSEQDLSVEIAPPSNPLGSLLTARSGSELVLLKLSDLEVDRIGHSRSWGAD